MGEKLTCTINGNSENSIIGVDATVSVSGNLEIVSVEKNPVDSVVHLVVEPEHEERAFSLGQARNVKRIRGSVLR